MQKIPSYIWIITVSVLGVAFLFALVAGESQKPSKIEERIYSAVLELNLNLDQFKTAFKSNEIKKIIEDDKAELEKRFNNLKENIGTPAIFIDGTRFNPKTLDDLYNIEETLLAIVADPSVTEENKVLLEVFSDYNCPHCMDFDPYLIELKANEDLMKKVEIKKRHYPFLKDTSLMFAYAAESARLQGAFDELNTKLYEIAQNRTVDSL